MSFLFFWRVIEHLSLTPNLLARLPLLDPLVTTHPRRYRYLCPTGHRLPSRYPLRVCAAVHCPRTMQQSGLVPVPPPPFFLCLACLLSPDWSMPSNNLRNLQLPTELVDATHNRLLLFFTISTLATVASPKIQISYTRLKRLRRYCSSTIASLWSLEPQKASSQNTASARSSTNLWRWNVASRVCTAMSLVLRRCLASTRLVMWPASGCKGSVDLL